MIVVTAPDGSAVNFPDNTSESVINQAMMEKFSPEAENSLAGSAKSLAAGLGEGAIDLLGMPADAANLLTKGSDWLAGKITGTEASQGKTILDTLGSENIKKNVENITGEFYKPQTSTEKFIKTGASFAPAALLGPGGVARRVATQAVIPGVASEAAWQLTEGTEAEPYARVGGALLGGIGGAKAAQMATKPNLAAVPAIEDISKAKTAGYQSQAIKVLEIKPQYAEKVADTIINNFNRQKFSSKNPEVATVRGLVDDLRKPEFGANHTIADFDNTRQRLSEIAGAGGSGGKAATIAIRSIDAATLRIPTPFVAAGNARAASKELFEARKNAAVEFRNKKVSDVLEMARNNAVSTHSGANLENEIYKQVRTMLKPGNKALRGWSEEEKQALRDVLPGLGRNALRRGGKLLGGGGGLGQLASGSAGGAMFGFPGMVALPALGMGLNKLGSMAATKKINKVGEVLRSRSPLYGKKNQQAYLLAQQGGGLLGNLPPQQAMAIQALIAAHPELVNQ